MSMLVPAFARTVRKRRVERNTFVICRKSVDTYSMRDFFAQNWNKLNHTSEMDKIFIGLCRNSNIFQHKSTFKDFTKIDLYFDLRFCMARDEAS
jgi:hypothetical protein